MDPSWGSRSLQGWRLFLSAQNLFDARPPFFSESPSGLNYDPSQRQRDRAFRVGEAVEEVVMESPAVRGGPQ